ncbi:IS1 family transposase, partial [Escherichia coli]|uniref:IS1 family transposase n=1 Tax=Escherichia coli TaxID=562 RepID=UPI002169A6CC
RAKARKLEQQQANAEPEEQVDPRKAAVEAAIARAKARKLEQQQANAEPEEQVDPRNLARLGRKSLSFSKSVELHDKVIGHYLNIKHYQ